MGFEELHKRIVEETEEKRYGWLIQKDRYDPDNIIDIEWSAGDYKLIGKGGQTDNLADAVAALEKEPDGSWCEVTDNEEANTVALYVKGPKGIRDILDTGIGDDAFNVMDYYDKGKPVEKVKEAIGEYVVLTKIENEADAEAIAKDMGYSSAKDFEEGAGESLVGYWADTGKDTLTKPPSDAKEAEIGPIAVLVHGRLYSEKKIQGYISPDGKTAFVSDSDYQELL